MSAWGELAAKYNQSRQESAGAPGPAPAQDKVDVWRALAAAHKQPIQSATSPNPDNSDFGMRMQKIVLDMPWYQKAATALGAGFADIGMTAKQLTGRATQNDVDEKRKIDSFITNDPASSLLKFGGAYVPAMAIPTGPIGAAVSKFSPSLGPVVEGMVQGGAGNFMQPTGTGESRLFNTLTGATLGGVPPGVGTIYRNAVGAVSPEAAALAKKAIDQYKIPLQASDITDSRFVKSLNSMFKDMPVTGGIANARNDAKQVAFNRAVSSTYGAGSDRLTADANQRAYDALQSNFNAVYSRNPADAFKVNAQLDPVIARVAREGTADEQRIVNSRLGDLYSKIDPGTGTIDGNAFNRWQSDLRKRAGNNDLLNQFRGAALKGYNDSVSADDANLLNTTRAQYRNYKIVEPLLEKAPTGDVSPGLLQGRVASQTSDYARGGGGDLGDLARIGSRFMVDRTPQTGGSNRALLQNSMLANAVALPTVAPLALGMNSNFMRDSIINKALGTGFFDTTPGVGLLSDVTKRVATQAMPAYVNGGLLAY